MEKYYGWLGKSGYDGLVKIKDYSEAYVFKNGEYVRNDDFLKAMFDPGSDFEEISKEEADALLESW